MKGPSLSKKRNKTEKSVHKIRQNQGNITYRTGDKLGNNTSTATSKYYHHNLLPNKKSSKNKNMSSTTRIAPRDNHSDRQSKHLTSFSKRGLSSDRFEALNSENKASQLIESIKKRRRTDILIHQLNSKQSKTISSSKLMSSLSNFKKGKNSLSKIKDVLGTKVVRITPSSTSPTRDSSNILQASQKHQKLRNLADKDSERSEIIGRFDNLGSSSFNLSTSNNISFLTNKKQRIQDKKRGIQEQEIRCNPQGGQLRVKNYDKLNKRNLKTQKKFKIPQNFDGYLEDRYTPHRRKERDGIEEDGDSDESEEDEEYREGIVQIRGKNRSNLNASSQDGLVNRVPYLSNKSYDSKQHNSHYDHEYNPKSQQYSERVNNLNKNTSNSSNNKNNKSSSIPKFTMISDSKFNKWASSQDRNYLSLIKDRTSRKTLKKTKLSFEKKRVFSKEKNSYSQQQSLISRIKNKKYTFPRTRRQEAGATNSYSKLKQKAGPFGRHPTMSKTGIGLSSQRSKRRNEVSSRSPSLEKGVLSNHQNFKSKNQIYSSVQNKSSAQSSSQKSKSKTKSVYNPSIQNFEKISSLFSKKNSARVRHGKASGSMKGKSKSREKTAIGIMSKKLKEVLKKKSEGHFSLSDNSKKVNLYQKKFKKTKRKILSGVNQYNIHASTESSRNESTVSLNQPRGFNLYDNTLRENNSKKFLN